MIGWWCILGVQFVYKLYSQSSFYFKHLYPFPHSPFLFFLSSPFHKIMGYNKFSAALGINFSQGSGNIPGGFTPWTLDRRIQTSPPSLKTLLQRLCIMTFPDNWETQAAGINVPIPWHSDKHCWFDMSNKVEGLRGNPRLCLFVLHFFICGVMPYNL